MKIQQIDPAKLTPADYNPRKISDHQAEALKRSLDRWGFVEPIVANKRTGKIVGGHQRVDAALALAVAKVPVHWVDLDEDSEKALNIALNKISGEWEDNRLAELLTELEQGGQDLEDLGFDPDELQAIIDAAAPEPELSGDLDAIPEPPAEPITQPGDLWQLGEHRLLCGDSTKAEDVARLMGDDRAILLHADPPYGMGKESEGVLNDNLYSEKLDRFQMDWWQTFRPHLEDNASAYIWGNAPDLWRLWYVGGLADSERLTVRNEIVWDKGVSGLAVGTEAGRMFQSSERCLFFMLGEQGFNNNADNYWEGWDGILEALRADCHAMGWGASDIKRICGVGMYGHWFTRSQWTFIPEEHYRKLQAAAREHGAFKREHDELKREHDELKREFYATRAYFNNTHDNMTDVWSFPRVVGEERHGHATPKPVAMVARALKSSSPPDSLVIEPFLGSGSTIIAAEQTGRKCYAMELSPAYCDVAVKRWEQATGKKAERVSNG